MELANLKDEYLVRRLGDCSPRTPAKYGYAVTHFERWLGRSASVADLSDDQLVEFRRWLMAGGRSRATANSYVQHLNALSNYAFRRGYLRAAPTVRDLPTVQRAPIALTVEDIGKLLEACTRLEYSIATVPASAWWRAMLLVLYDTGVRVGAARQLRFGDVLWSSSTLLIRGETQKTLKDLHRPVSVETLSALRDIEQPRRSDVFCWDRSETYLWRRSRQLFDLAGFPRDPRYQLHALRRTHGTMIAAQLGDFAAADSLQHSSVTTFRKHYRDGSKIDGTKLLDALPRPKIA